MMLVDADLYKTCEYVLPCGICRMTMQQCPKMPFKVEPTWTSTTSGTGTVTVNAMEGMQKNADD